MAEIESLLDPQNQNITFTDFNRLVQSAQEWLSATWSRKVAAVPTHRRLKVDAAKRMRNCIAHQSQRSFLEMNTALQALPTTGNGRLLRRQLNAVTNVGSYLKALQEGRTRVQIFLDEFHQLAGQLK